MSEEADMFAMFDHPAVGLTEVSCQRCGKPAGTLAEAEVCWFCTGPLCYACWDKYGHCGHPEAEAANEQARRAVPEE